MESIQKDLLVVVGLDSIGGSHRLSLTFLVKHSEEEKKPVSMQPVVMVRCELTTDRIVVEVIVI
jgi:hypothetical protein